MGMRERASKVVLSISTYKGTKIERRVSQEVADLHDIKGKSGTFKANLFPGCDEEIKALNQAESAIRDYHYDHTFDWRRGERLLPSELFLPYVKHMGTLRGIYEQRLDNLLSVWDSRVEQAFKNRGSLANRRDYPSLDQVKSACEVRVNISPLEDPNDWRLKVEDEALQAAVDEATLQASEEARDEQEKLLQEGMSRVWERFNKVLDNAKRNLQVTKGTGRYRSEWVSNLQEFLEVVDGLNLTDDPKLKDLASKARSAMSAIDPDAVEDDTEREGPRAEASQKVEEICDQMSALFSPED
jgi:hypothetical protein